MNIYFNNFLKSNINSDILMNTYILIICSMFLWIIYRLICEVKINKNIIFSLEEKTKFLEKKIIENYVLYNDLKNDFNKIKDLHIIDKTNENIDKTSENIDKTIIKICDNKYINKKYFDTIIKDTRTEIQDKLSHLFGDLVNIQSRIDGIVKNDHTCDKIVIHNDVDKESVFGILNNEINILKNQYKSVYETIAQSRSMMMNYDNIFSNLKYEVDKFKTSLNYYNNMITSHEYTIAYVNNTLLNEISLIKNFIDNNTNNMLLIINNEMNKYLNKFITKKEVNIIFDLKINSIMYTLHKNWNNSNKLCKLFKINSSIRIEIILWSIKTKLKIFNITNKSDFEIVEYNANIFKDFIEYSKNSDLLQLWDNITQNDFTPEQNEILKNLYPKL